MVRVTDKPTIHILAPQKKTFYSTETSDKNVIVL